MPEANEETIGIEVADGNTVTARVETGRPNVNALEESDTTDLEIGRNEPAHLGGVGHRFECGQKLVLLVPVFAGRTYDWRLLDGEPSERRFVFARELLLSIPATCLRVEVGRLDLPNVEQGHRCGRCGDEGIIVGSTPLERVLGRQTFGKSRDLFVSVHDARSCLRDFLRRDEIYAEDRTG